MKGKNNTVKFERTKEYLDGKVMQTFLFTGHGSFYVSTAYREDYDYYETFGWKLDKDNQKVAGTLMDATRGSSSRKVGIQQHYEMCNSLEKDGTYSYDNRNVDFISQELSKAREEGRMSAMNELKRAFSKVFYKSGELWFDYLFEDGDTEAEEDAKAVVEGYWEDILSELKDKN